MNAPASLSTLSTTPLATLLAGETEPFCGVLTPRQLDAPEREWEALTSAAAMHDLGWLCRFAVQGEDRFRWLNGMVTNTVEALAANTGAWNLVLNAQGRIQGDLTVWREGDGSEADSLELEIAADQSEKLLAHLDHFIIMDDVELKPLREETAIGLTGPNAASVLKVLGLSAPIAPFSRQRVIWKGNSLLIERLYGAQVEHYALWVKPEALAELWKTLLAAGVVAVGSTSLEALRIAEAIPVYGIDMVERDLPQETSQMRALHFDKGCYQGQEIVERIRSRGNVHFHLRQIELDGPLPDAGVELSYRKTDGSVAAAGKITSAIELPTGLRLALAMIRAEAEIRPQPLLYAEKGRAQVLSAPPALR
jgi:folate-binding protein YgfZ